MSEVEQLAQEQFNTFKTRLCEILCEIEEEHKSAFIQGYAKGEIDEKFRINQVVTKHIADLEKKYDTRLRENTGLKIHNAYVEKKLIEGREVVLSLYNAIRDYLMITSDETFDRLNKAINDKRIEKFIEDTKNS